MLHTITQKIFLLLLQTIKFHRFYISLDSLGYYVLRSSQRQEQLYIECISIVIDKYNSMYSKDHLVSNRHSINKYSFYVLLHSICYAAGKEGSCGWTRPGHKRKGTREIDLNIFVNKLLLLLLLLYTIKL